MEQFVQGHSSYCLRKGKYANVCINPRLFPQHFNVYICVQKIPFNRATFSPS